MVTFTLSSVILSPRPYILDLKKIVLILCRAFFIIADPSIILPCYNDGLKITVFRVIKGVSTSTPFVCLVWPSQVTYGLKE